MGVDTCAFLPCEQADSCCLPGGCMKRGHVSPALEPCAPVHYNPMTGQRTDLTVTDEDGEKAAARWQEGRRKYLRQLLRDRGLSSTAREIYRRELEALG